MHFGFFLVWSGLALVPALQLAIPLQHFEIIRVLAADLGGIVPFKHTEPRDRCIKISQSPFPKRMSREELLFQTGQQGFQLLPARFKGILNRLLVEPINPPEDQRTEEPDCGNHKLFDNPRSEHFP